MSDEPTSVEIMTAVTGHVAVLASGPPREQKAAREALVALGRPVLPGLVAAYHASPAAARYEIIRVVAELQYASAAPVLVEALAGADEDVRFIAAEGLVGLEDEALDALLAALAGDAGNAALQDGARQVLAEFAQSELGPVVAPVAAALANGEGGGLLIDACRAAMRALVAWRTEAA